MQNEKLLYQNVIKVPKKKKVQTLILFLGKDFVCFTKNKQTKKKNLAVQQRKASIFKEKQQQKVLFILSFRSFPIIHCISCIHYMRKVIKILVLG